MARVGFKKTYAPSDFATAAVVELFNHIKTHMLEAGFQLLSATDETFEVIQAGAMPGTTQDDVPHWAFRVQEQGPAGVIEVMTIFGSDLQDPAAHIRNFLVVHSGFIGIPSPEITFWFSADGASGSWWIHGLQVDASSSNGFSSQVAAAGVTSRRYPSDNYQGLCARYGIWTSDGAWQPAYAVTPDGNLNQFPATTTWSPFGQAWAFNSRRHAGSVLPKMAVPAFPSLNNGITACILGEYNEVLLLTDGYASEDRVLPGWVAMIGNSHSQPYAAPAPEIFTVL